MEFSCNTEKKDESETRPTSCARNESIRLRQGDLHQFSRGIPRASVRVEPRGHKNNFGSVANNLPKSWTNSTHAVAVGSLPLNR